MNLFRIEPFSTPFGERQFLIREALFHLVDILIFTSVIPVESYSPDIFGRFGVIQHIGYIMVGKVTIVIPGDDAAILHLILFQGRPHVILDKIVRHISVIDTRFPCLHRLRFVLDSQAPNRKSLCFIALDILDKIVRPRLIKFLFQFSTTEHVVVGLHPCGRRPRADIENKVIPYLLLRHFNHRELEFTVGRNIKRLQTAVILRYIIIARARKVATVHIGSYHRISYSIFAIISIYNLLLFLFRQFGKRFCRRIRDSSSKTDHFIILMIGVYINISIVTHHSGIKKFGGSLAHHSSIL